MGLDNTTCYLCGHSNYHLRKGVVRDDPSMQIRECENCSMVMLGSFQHIQTGHYEESGMHGDEKLSIESWLRETEQDDQRRFDMFKTALTNKKLLDFGCGKSVV